MNLGLSGLLTLITGCSGGFSFGIVRVIAEDSCDIALCSRSAESLLMARSELTEVSLSIGVPETDRHCTL